jgi:hypothetical protein
VLDYLSKIHIGPRDVVQVFIPEYVVGHWWETILHNQSALRLKGRLLYMPGVMVTSVPFQLKSAEPFTLGPPGTDADVAVPPSPHPGPTGSAQPPPRPAADTSRAAASRAKVLASSGR